MFEDSSITQSISRIKNALEFTLKSKYKIENPEASKKMLQIHGLNKEKFDFVNNVEEVISAGVADSSIDQNSNKNELTVAGIMNEATNSVNKVVGFRYLYRKMKDMYGKPVAKKLSGEMYDLSLAIADSTKILSPYCYSIDASKIVLEGRKFGQVPSAPPKRLASYIAALNETVHQLSNHLAGACAVGSIFLDAAYILLYREKISLFELKYSSEIKKYIENCFQSFVHSVNHLSRNSVESPFSNISVFDREKLLSILSNDNMGWYFDEIIEEKKTKEEWISYVVDCILEIQEIFLQFFDKGDPLSGGRPYRFPVVTMNVSKRTEEDGSIALLDKKFIEKISEHEIYKYNIMVSEGSKVASCCFDESQKVLLRNSEKGEMLVSIKEAIDVIPNNSNTKIFHNGFWKSFTKVKIPYTGYMLKIQTSNNKEIIVTPDHVLLTLNGEKRADELSEEDYLMFSTNSLGSRNQKHSELTYEQGFLIGCFLGDGSYMSLKKGTERIYRGITLSLNKSCVYLIKKNVDKAIKQFGINYESKVCQGKNNVVFLFIHNTELAKILLNYVPHNIAPNKYFNERLLGSSVACREGILRGLYETDGGNSNRIYTVSKRMLFQIEALCTTLGKNTIINEDDRIGEVEFHGKKFKKNYVLNCIRVYKKSKSKSIFYKWKNNSVFYKIKNIEKTINSSNFVYCFNMKDESDPYFTLPNGIITHNCRLISDTEMLSLGNQMNSFGGSAISLGSHRVITVNINRIALEATDEENFFEILKERIHDSALILKAHKELLKDTMSWGLQPFMKNGWIRMNRLFSTFGILGIVEARDTLQRKFSIKGDAIEKILKFFNERVNVESAENNIFGNIEQIPGETMAIKLAKADRILFGEENVPNKIYANQFIPLWENATIWERMDADGKYNKMFTGGGICHFSLGERITSVQINKIIEYACTSGCEHFALNSVYSECEEGHNSFGNFKMCPVCGKNIVEKYTRVVGFMTPVSSWNKERREWEFPKRIFNGI